MNTDRTDIFEMLRNGAPVPFSDPDYYRIKNACVETKKLLNELNNLAEPQEIRTLLGKITNTEIPATTGLFTPFHINYGRNTTFGKNIFINFDCVFLDLGGIEIEDDVMLAPGVKLLSEGHPIDSRQRQTLTTGKIHIKKNVWIGANAIILQGVTIGENAVVAAGAVVSQNVPANTVVGGVPAKAIKNL